MQQRDVTYLATVSYMSSARLVIAALILRDMQNLAVNRNTVVRRFSRKLPLETPKDMSCEAEPSLICLRCRSKAGEHFRG